MILKKEFMQYLDLDMTLNSNFQKQTMEEKLQSDSLLFILHEKMQRDHSPWSQTKIYETCGSLFFSLCFPQRTKVAQYVLIQRLNSNIISENTWEESHVSEFKKLDNNLRETES